MLIELLEKKWLKIENIGGLAEERGKSLGLKPSWNEPEPLKDQATSKPTAAKPLPPHSAVKKFSE